MPAGRPGKLTPEIQQRLCTAIAAGNYYEAACAYAGLGYRTFCTWMRRGKKASRGRFRQFRQAVLKAEADAEATIVAQWRQQIPENWQAARDFLARRYAKRWSATDRHEVTGKDGGAVKLEATVAVYLPAKDTSHETHPSTNGAGSLPQKLG